MGLKESNMQIFYKFFVKNSKSLIVFIVVLIFHFYLVYDLNLSAQKVEAKYELQKTHQKAQTILAENLMNECDLFKNVGTKEKIKSLLSESRLTYELSKSLAIELDDLAFSKVIFQTYNEDQTDIRVTSVGYMLEYRVNKKCFGVI